MTNGLVKTVKPFRIEPRVIFLKNSRDKVLLMTDKRDRKDVPECEHGFWGGFSPKRVGKYEDQYLSKQHQSSGSRIFAGNRKIQGAIK